MSGLTTVLRVGLRIHHDGAVFTVVEIAGRRLLLSRHGDGDLRQVEVGWLLAHPSTHVVGAEAGGGPAAGVVLASLDAEEDHESAEQVAHVQEVLTGYRHGCRELVGEGEPRAEYAPGVPRMAQYAAKAAGLRVGVSTLRRWVAAFERAGPQGLLRAGTGRGGGPTSNLNLQILRLEQDIGARLLERGHRYQPMSSPNPGQRCPNSSTSQTCATCSTPTRTRPRPNLTPRRRTAPRPTAGSYRAPRRCAPT